MKRLILILTLCVFMLTSACAAPLPEEHTPPEGAYYALYDTLAQNRKIDSTVDITGTEAIIALQTFGAQQIRLVRIDLAEEAPEIKEEISPPLRGTVEEISIAADGSIWLAIEEEEEHQEGEDIFFLYSSKICRIDGQGALLNTFPLPEDVRPSQIEAITDDAGVEKICIQTEDTILLYDTQGRQLASMPHKGSIFCAGDGRLMAWSGLPDTLAVLDPGNLSIKSSYDLSGMRIKRMYPGDTQVPLYMTNEQGIYALDLETLALIPRISYAASGLPEIPVRSIIQLENGDYRILVFEGGREPFGLWRLQTVESYERMHGEGSFPQKETIVLATLLASEDTAQLVSEFNRKNAQYQVIIKDYSMVAPKGDWRAGLEALSKDIIAGEVPDILDMTGLSAQSMARKDLLADLKPLLQEDSVLSEDMFLPHILNGHETDGRLPMISPFFVINTLAGKKSVMEAVAGWSVADAQAFSQALPEGAALFGDLTGAMLAEDYATSFASGYIDWKTGTCRFDSDEFIQALEWIASLPKEAPYARMQGSDPLRTAQFVDDLRKGRFSLARMSVTSVWGAQVSNELLGEQACFVETPGQPGATATMTATYGILKDSAHIQGAWQFLRQLLLPEYGATNPLYLPVNREALDARLQMAMTPPKEPEDDDPAATQAEPDPNPDTDKDAELYNEATDFIWAGDGWIFAEDLQPPRKAGEKKPPLEPKAAEQLMELIDSVTRVNFVDMHVTAILTEEIDVLLGGGRTAAETAQIIQTRVQLYLGEQYRP